MNKQLDKLFAEPSGEFDNFVRMSVDDFIFLLLFKLQKISPIIAKKHIDWRDAIPARIRLAVTLRYLATGDSYKSLHHLFKISPQIISKIMKYVLHLLYLQ